MRFSSGFIHFYVLLGTNGHQKEPVLGLLAADCSPGMLNGYAPEYVHEKMGCEVRNGDVFIFIGSSRRLMKLLHAEDGGMVMYVKRLEAGRFRLPAYDEKSKTYPMEWRDLVVMVEGMQEDPEQRLKRLRAQRVEYVV